MRAARPLRHVDSGVVARMMTNVIVEAVADLVPVLGDVFDTAFKADLRNVALLERHFGMATP